jgi:hypothetical protein
MTARRQRRKSRDYSKNENQSQLGSGVRRLPLAGGAALSWRRQPLNSGVQ